MEVLLPHVTDLAAMVRRAGIDQVAAEFACSLDTVKRRLNDGGFTRGGHEDPDAFRFPQWDPKPWEEFAVCSSTDPEAYFPRERWVEPAREGGLLGIVPGP